MGLAQSALVLLGIGIVSSRFKAGVGLGELGTGIQTLIAAPLTGTGTGLSAFAGGVRDLSETLGDLGRGIGELFKNIPKLPEYTPFPELPGEEPSPWWYPSGENGIPRINGKGPPLITVSGGDTTTNLPGGGGNVPVPAPIVPYIAPAPTSPPSSTTSIYYRDRPVMM